MNKFLESYINYYMINLIIILLVVALLGSVIYYIVNLVDNSNRLYNSSYSFEATGIPVSGHEEDYLLMDNQKTIGMSQLLTRQGLEKISWQEATAFEGDEKDHDDTFLKYRQQYIIRTGRNYPPVYKIKFQIKTEQLSEKEAEEFWKKQILDN